MFIGLIGTRFSGKSTVVDYLKSRGFTALHLRGANEDDSASTAASSLDNAPNDTQQIVDLNNRASSSAGPSKISAIPIPGAQELVVPDLVPDLAGPTPVSEGVEHAEWTSRTPESHINRDELKEDIASAFRKVDPTRSHSTSSTLYFDSSTEILDYTTRNWRTDFVTEDLTSKELLDPFLKRPFFLLIEVDAPLMTRLHRARDITLEQLVSEHDVHMYGPGLGTQESSHHALRQLAGLTIINAYTDRETFWNYLNSLDLTSKDRLRPQWDSYFMTLASLASQRSNCMKRRVGAILVKHNRILATGYNGTPRGLTNCNEGGCSRCNGKSKSGEALDECLCLHAEENALLEAGRERLGDRAVLYCNTCPCLRCTVKIVQTGVKEVVYNLAYSMDAAAAEVFIAAGVTLRQHTPPWGI